MVYYNFGLSFVALLPMCSNIAFKRFEWVYSFQTNSQVIERYLDVKVKMDSKTTIQTVCCGHTMHV